MIIVAEAVNKIITGTSNIWSGAFIISSNYVNCKQGWSSCLLWNFPFDISAISWRKRNKIYRYCCKANRNFSFHSSEIWQNVLPIFFTNSCNRCQILPQSITRWLPYTCLKFFFWYKNINSTIFAILMIMFMPPAWRALF